MYNRKIVAMDGHAMAQIQINENNRRMYENEMAFRERELQIKERELELKEKALNAILNKSNNNYSHDGVYKISIPSSSTSNDISDDFSDEEIMKLGTMFNMIL